MAVDDTLRALAHPTRRAMLELVWDAERSSSELAEAVALTRPAASQHLKVLRDAGLVQVRVDSPTNPPIGSFAVANTGGWQSWRSVPGNVSAVTGRHTIYLTFTSGQPNDFVNVNWFTFRR